MIRDQLELIRDAAVIANEARTTEEAVAYCVRRLCEEYDWKYGHAYLVNEDEGGELIPIFVQYEAVSGRYTALWEALHQRRVPRPGELAGRVVASREPEWAEDIQGRLLPRQAQIAASLDLISAVAFPVLSGPQVVAILEFYSDRPFEPNPEMLESMVAIGVQLGRVLERERFKRELVEVTFREQERIARDLHDALGQDMAGLAMSAESLLRRLRRSGSSECEAMERVLTGLRRALQEVRHLSRGLSQISHRPGALVRALEELGASLGERLSTRIIVSADDAVSLGSDEAATHFYRIVQEAVHNALAHGDPDHVWIRLTEHNGGFLLEVEDDGRGLSENHIRGLGFRTMRQRVRLLGGKLQLRRGDRGGTLVACTVPKPASKQR